VSTFTNGSNQRSRIGDWFLTFTGKKFYPFDPRPEEICIEDIAHSLARVCRFGGHSRHFYSVAQHSVIVARNCPREARMTGLLHDATEAYCGDMVRPLKMMLPEYRRVEDRIWRKVCLAFNLNFEMPPIVKDLDNRVLLTERRDICMPSNHEWALSKYFEPLDEIIYPWSPQCAEAEFEMMFNSIKMDQRVMEEVK